MEYDKRVLTDLSLLLEHFNLSLHLRNSFIRQQYYHPSDLCKVYFYILSTWIDWMINYWAMRCYTEIFHALNKLHEVRRYEQPYSINHHKCAH